MGKVPLGILFTIVSGLLGLLSTFAFDRIDGQDQKMQSQKERFEAQIDSINDLIKQDRAVLYRIDGKLDVLLQKFDGGTR